jgi:hypothetical protein
VIFDARAFEHTRDIRRGREGDERRLRVVICPPPKLRRGRVCANLLAELAEQLGRVLVERELGECEIRLSEALNTYLYNCRKG